MEDDEAKRPRDETQQLREESRALRQNRKPMAAALSYVLLEKDRHGRSSWEDPGDEYERDGESGGY